MVVVSDRFECFPDPCDLWMVWDRWCALPAQASGVDLIGLTQAEAAAHCTVLNAENAGALVSSRELASLFKLDRS
jgi:hypothetical protein